MTTKIYGVTVDDVSGLSAVVTSLRTLSKVPTARIVFDEFVPATYYLNAVKTISPVSPIMGEILDSSYVKQYTVQQYKDRTTEYIDLLKDYVSIWEIGNEINGEWLGTISDVVAKMTGAYDIAKAKGVKTELTLYYNQDCWRYPSEEMFTWVNANVPERMKTGLDYVLVSYYEDDCNNLQPNWQQVFDRLGQIFPNSLIGIGECGTNKSQSIKESYIRRYYTMNINHPRYVGGYFWWYFVQDMVPNTKYLWGVLNEVLSSQPTMKYRCTGTPNYQCVEDPNGPYNSLAECQAACKVPVTKYRCTGAPNYQCVEDPNGPYNSLAECQAACKAPVTENMLLNPGFETGTSGDPSNWKKYATGTKHTYTYPETGRVGGSSVAIQYVTRETGKSAAWVQNVKIDVTKKYKLSGWVKTQSVVGSGASIGVDWFNSAGTWLNYAIIVVKTGTISWTYFEGVVTPVSGSTNANIVLYLNDSSGKVWFDDMSLTTELTVKYRCTGAPNYQCVEDPNGPYNSLAECQAACKVPVTKYRCTGAPNYQCVEDPNGPYNSLAECQAACKVPVTKYRCTGAPNYQCVEDPNGPYNSLAECQAACKVPVKKFDVYTIGDVNDMNGILVMKNTVNGMYTIDEACQLVCNKLKDMV